MDTTSSFTDMVTSTLAAMTTASTDGVPGNQKQAGAMMGEPVSRHLHYTMSAWVGPIVCFIGMVGNILSIIVWSKPGLRSSTGRYLIGLAIADFFVLFFFLVCDSAKEWNPDLVYSHSYAVFLCYIGVPFFFLAIVCSIWFTVGVTVDRYIMVCWITKAKHYCNEKRANVGLILILINSFIINMPHFMTQEPTHADNSNVTAGGKKMAAFAKTEFGAGAGGDFYEFWIHCIILIIIPWVAVLGMNIMIIRKVRHSNKKMSDKKTSQSMRASKSSEQQITRLLLLVTFTFLFFIGLQCIIQCLWMQKPPGADWEMVSRSYAFAKTGVVWNSTSNFFLYCFSGRRFRTALFDMFGLRKKHSMFPSVLDKPSTTGPSASTTSTTGI